MLRFRAKVDRADGDPLDICVISERPITRSEILLSARVVGGIQMVDDGEADDKIVAVLDNDPFWDKVEELASVPKALVERLVHYFSTYKLMPWKENRVSIVQVYDRKQRLARDRSGHRRLQRVVRARSADAALLSGLALCGKFFLAPEASLP